MCIYLDWGGQRETVNGVVAARVLSMRIGNPGKGDGDGKWSLGQQVCEWNRGMRAANACGGKARFRAAGACVRWEGRG